jgi:GntR family transcriptional regulator
MVVRQRVFLINDQPVALCDSYYPLELVAGTAIVEPGRIRGGALALTEDRDGPIRRRVARSVERLTARMPAPSEADQLGLEPGVPVIRVLRTVYDEGGTALELQVSIAAADSHEFCYEVDLR